MDERIKFVNFPVKLTPTQLAEVIDGDIPAYAGENVIIFNDGVWLPNDHTFEQKSRHYLDICEWVIGGNEDE